MAYFNNPNNRRREKPGRFGTDIAFVHKVVSTWTANTTTYDTIPTPFTPVNFIERLSYSVQTAGADADGTMLITIQKVRGGSSGTITDLTGAVSVEVDVATFVPGTFSIPFLSTLVPADFVILAGDVVRVKKVNNSAAIDTQPVDLGVVVELAVGE